MKVMIDDDHCVGCMMCVDTCPEIFKSDGDIAIVITDFISNDLKEKCMNAVKSCHVETISVINLPSNEETQSLLSKALPIASGTNWYFVENQDKNLKQLVLTMPPGNTIEAETSMLMLAEQYHHLIVNASSTGLYRTDTKPDPILMIRTDGYIEEVKEATLRIGFSFFRTATSGIVGIYVSLDSNILRNKLCKQNPYLEIGYGLDEPKGIERLKDAFMSDSLDITLAEKGNVSYNIYNQSTGGFDSYQGPQCKYNIHIDWDTKCKEILYVEFENILKYHNSIPADKRDFQAALNHVWELMPLEDDPILQDNFFFNHIKN